MEEMIVVVALALLPLPMPELMGRWVAAGRKY